MIGLLLFTACSDYELKSLSTPIEQEESYLSANTDGLINIEEEEDTSAEEVGSTVEVYRTLSRKRRTGSS